MINNNIILNKKVGPLVYIYIMILIICALSLIIVCMLFHYKVYYFFKGNVFEEDGIYYLKCYIPILEAKYVASGDSIIIDKKEYKYDIKSISNEYFNNNNETYQEIVLNINFDDKYKYNNLVINLKLIKEDKKIIEYLKEMGGKND